VPQLKSVNLARGISGAISLVIVTLILLFLVFYKAYTTTLQRFFVHLTIVTCLHDVSFVIQLEHQFEYRGQKQFCTFVGFLDMWREVEQRFEQSDLQLAQEIECLLLSAANGNVTEITDLFPSS